MQTQPYLKIYDFEGNLIEGLLFNYFSYTHSEEGDDLCKIIAEFGNPDVMDEAWMQDTRPITIEWGYRNTEKFQKRKVYIRDVTPDFYSNSMSVTIEATDKASLLKQRNQPGTYSGSLLDIAGEIANEGGLTLDYSGLTGGKKFTTITEFDTQMIAAPKPLTDEELENFKANYVNPLDPNTPYNKALATLGFSPTDKFIPAKAQELAEKRMKATLSPKTYDNVPLGSQSRLGFLQDELDQTGGGQYVIEGRDDKLIVKKRDFSQAPIRTYTLKQEPRQLVRFTPGTKNRSDAAGADSATVSFWDKASKEYGEVTADTYTDTTPRLGEVDDYSSQDRYNYINSSFIQPIDNTRLVRDFVVGFPTSEERYPPNNRSWQSTGLSPQEAAAEASSYRSKVAFEKNQGSATIIGDPGIISGKLINVQGVSLRFSGNYYITKVTHEIRFKGNYLCLVSLARNGTGFSAASRPNARPVTEDPKIEVNKETAPEEDLDNKVEIEWLEEPIDNTYLYLPERDVDVNNQSPIE